MHVFRCQDSEKISVLELNTCSYGAAISLYLSVRESVCGGVILDLLLPLTAGWNWRREEKGTQTKENRVLLK